MTNEEAITRIVEHMAIHKMNESRAIKVSMALQMAVHSLERQIPKKPRPFVAFDGIERSGCPTCPRDEILYARQEYCSVCGQKICWSEDENGV